ncbi:MAG: hypothetical protein HN348_03905, partial [Proteobacteria bacterium]|nr:hypothetical protein [Pseudomonadota bacterium]
MVLKVAHQTADFPTDAPLPANIVDDCRKCLNEQAALLRDAAFPFLPRLDQSIKLAGGTPALILPKYSSMEKTTLTLRRSLEILVSVTRALRNAGRIHGNLHQGNIFINERGEPVLSDLLTPTSQALRLKLLELATHIDNVPPESTEEPTPKWDTWALCLVAYRAAMCTSAQGPEPITTPREGLDKVDLATLKDRAMARLKTENANPRFSGRVTARMGAILNRGLSLNDSPSPPYRFDTASDLLPRLEETVGLLEPRVEEVGKLLLAPSAKNNVFEGGEQVSFSVTVATSPMLNNHEDIASGINLHDIDADGKGRVSLSDVTFAVTSHPSGRLRFEFQLPTIVPGRYRVRVAFSIKDSGHEPLVSTGEFQVRPPPGYVPPSEPLPVDAQPIRFPGLQESWDPGTCTDPDEPPSDPYSSPGELVEGVFPVPIAPSTHPGEIDEPRLPPIPPPEPTRPPMVESPWAAPPPLAVVPKPDTSPTLAPDQEEPLPEPEDLLPPSWETPGQWEDQLPSPDEQKIGAIDPMLPDIEGEDLPTWEEQRSRSNGIGEWVENN